MKSSLIVVGLIAVTLFVSVDATQFEFFDMLSKQDFGKTLIQMIQLEMGQENSVDRVLGMLTSMKEGAE
jgi:hypothetical protein